MRQQRLIVLALVVAIYAALSHYSNSNPNAKWLGVVLSLGPILLIGSLALWRFMPWFVSAPVTVLVAFLLFRFWGTLEARFEWADLAQQAAVYGLIGFGFFQSLLPGRQPLCAMLAAKLHGELSAVEARYMRSATWIWALFYVLIAATVVVLFFLTPIRIWSMFVNFGVFVLIALMVVADLALRRRLLPHHPRTNILTALRQALIG